MINKACLKSESSIPHPCKHNLNLKPVTLSTSIKPLGKYVDFKTDFGMKFYFGREANKVILLDFLNDLFAGEKVIIDLKYLPTEQDGETASERRALFDLLCKGANGELFIIEMQQISQDFFLDRAVYYTSRLISKQLPKGKAGNNYALPEVYFIALLEFELGEEWGKEYLYNAAIVDLKSHQTLYDKLFYKFLVLPNFTKTASELTTDMDQWLYLLKHMSQLNELPQFLDKRIFSLIFNIGEVAKLNKEDLMNYEYEAKLKRKMDMRSILSTARRRGMEEGLLEGETKGIAKGIKEGEEKKSRIFVERLLKEGSHSVEQIANLADVSMGFVMNIKKGMNT